MLRHGLRPAQHDDLRLVAHSRNLRILSILRTLSNLSVGLAKKQMNPQPLQKPQKPQNLFYPVFTLSFICYNINWFELSFTER